MFLSLCGYKNQNCSSPLYMYMIATKGNMLRPPKIMCEESQGKISLTAICAFGFCSLVVGGHSARPLGIVFCKSRQTLAKQAIYAGFPGNLRDFLSPQKKPPKLVVPRRKNVAQLAVGQLQDEGANLGLAVLRGGRKPRDGDWKVYGEDGALADPPSTHKYP